jgi:hypothetical protein
MWTLSPEYIQQVKEELKGRRAAIQARHAEELRSLDTDLEEIETLERMAYAVAAKHLPEPADAAPQAEPEPETEADAQPLAELKPEAEPAAAASKGLSRWRMRLDANSEPEAVGEKG